MRRRKSPETHFAGQRNGTLRRNSAAELGRLIAAADTVCVDQGRKPELVVLRGMLG